jgi:hypothetical protein
MRTRPVRLPTNSRYRSTISSSGPAGRNRGAMRSAIARLTHISTKKMPVKMRPSASLAPSTPPQTSVRPSSLNHK